MEIVRKLVSKQMLRAITYCELKRTFCKWSTKNYCLALRHCPYREVKENSYRRKELNRRA